MKLGTILIISAILWLIIMGPVKAITQTGTLSGYWTINTSEYQANIREGAIEDIYGGTNKSFNWARDYIDNYGIGSIFNASSTALLAIQTNTTNCVQITSNSTQYSASCNNTLGYNNWTFYEDYIKLESMAKTYSFYIRHSITTTLLNGIALRITRTTTNYVNFVSPHGSPANFHIDALTTPALKIYTEASGAYTVGDVEVPTDLFVSGTISTDRVLSNNLSVMNSTDQYVTGWHVLDGSATIRTDTNVYSAGTITGSGSLTSSADFYTTGAGDDLWLGTSTQSSASFKAYATGQLDATNATFTNITVGSSKGMICSNSTSLILCSPGVSCPCG